MTKTRTFKSVITTLLMLVIMLCGFAVFSAIEVSANTAGGCDGDHDGYTIITAGTITEPGNYYLTADLTCETNDPVITVKCQGTVTLCLNGFDVYHSGNSYNTIGIESDGGELTVNLCDCKGTGEIYHSGDNGGISFVGEDYHKTFNMYGATIRNCTFGITTSENMTVNMYGGTITQCSYYAIFQSEDSGNGAARVNIFGGSIIDNREGIRVTQSDCVTLTGSPLISGNYYGDLYFRLSATVTVKELNVSDKITVGQEEYKDFPIAVVDTPDAFDSFESLYTEKHLVYYNGKIAFHGAEHQWIDATCVSPKLCELCGETEGEVDENAHRSDGGENCADCGEHAFVTINGETYAILGDITNTGIRFNHNESPAPGAWKAGDGYLVLVVKDSYYADVILYNATIDVRAIEDVVAVDIIKDYLDYYVYGTNNIYGNNRRAFHNGTVGEDTITNFIIDEDAVLNIYGNSDFDHLVVTSGEMNVYGRDISGDVGIAMQVIKSLTVKEGATLTAVGGKSDMGITVGIWVRKETVVDGVLNAFIVNPPETQEKPTITFIVNGDVVLNCDTFNVYPEESGYEIFLSVSEGASLTVPEGIKIDLDSFTGVEIDGELIVEGTLICTHEGGEATCTAPAVCDVCKQSYGNIDENAHSWNEGVVTTNPTCSAVGVKTFTCTHNSAHTKTEDVAIDATAHAWNEGVVTTDPTCTEKGVKTFTCTHSSAHTKTEDVAIDATAHAWNEGVVTTDPTCTEKGVKTFTCMHNSAHTKTNEVSDLGHAYDNACDATCNTCGEEKIPADHVNEDENNTCDICGAEIPKDGLSGGVVAGIAVGATAAVGLSTFSLFWFVIKKKNWSDLVRVFKK